jgi:hypothetical protein
VTRAVTILALLLLVAFVQCAGACTVAACDTAQEQDAPPCHQKKAELKPGCEHKIAAAEAQVNLSPESVELPAEAPVAITASASFDPPFRAAHWTGDPPHCPLPLRI